VIAETHTSSKMSSFSKGMVLTCAYIEPPKVLSWELGYESLKPKQKTRLKGCFCWPVFANLPVITGGAILR